MKEKGKHVLDKRAKEETCDDSVYKEHDSTVRRFSFEEAMHFMDTHYLRWKDATLNERERELWKESQETTIEVNLARRCGRDSELPLKSFKEPEPEKPNVVDGESIKTIGEYAPTFETIQLLKNRNEVRPFRSNGSNVPKSVTFKGGKAVKQSKLDSRDAAADFLESVSHIRRGSTLKGKV
jgi:hypothetical protein